jgi:hypothetical protein
MYDNSIMLLMFEFRVSKNECVGVKADLGENDDGKTMTIR